MSDFDIQIQARAVAKLELVTHDVTIQSECEILHKCGTVLTPLLKRAFKFRQKDHEFVWRASTVVSEIHRAWKYMKNIFDLNAKLDALHEAAIEVHLQVLKDEERGRLLPAGLFRHEPSMDPIAVLEGDVMTIVKNAPILDLNTEYILQMKEMKDVIEARKKDEEKNAEVMQILEEHKQRLDEEERALEERRKRIDQEFEDRQKQINAKYEEDRQDLDRRMAEMQKKSDDEAEAARKKQEMRRLQELKDKALAERLARKEAENADLKELQANFKKLELERKEIERQTKKDVERRKAEHEAFEEKYRRDRARHREELLSGWKQDFPRQDMRKNENVKVSSSVKIEGGAYNRRQPRRQRSKSVDGFEWEQVHPADSHRKRSKNPFVDFSIDTSIHEAPEDYYMQPRPFRHSMSRQQFLPPDFYASLPHRSSHNVATTIISNSFNTDTVFADNHYVSRPRRGGRYYDY